MPEDHIAERDTRIIDNLGDQEEIIPFQYSITSYGADYPVDSLISRLNDESIYVPLFQRRFVWTLRQASRFVESLLLGLPVPGIFLSKEEETQKLLVIDGQQRLKTLQFFYNGIFADTGREFSLREVQQQFQGTTYRSLSDEDRRRLNDSIIHATIVRQDEPSEDKSSIYHIFERLNTGGTRLNPQEIRACIYHGEFSGLLDELNGNVAWRSVYGPPSPRMRDQELILRFLALRFASERYERPMKKFLNVYMGSNRRLARQSREDITNAFSQSIEFIAAALGTRTFRPRRFLNAAVFDAVMVGVSMRLQRGPIVDRDGFVASYEGLMQSEGFVTATETGTAREARVHGRLEMATEAFAGVR